MGLNKSKGNMYTFVTHTWNAIKGACHHGCTYCYMKRWGNQNPVRLDEKEFKTDLGSGNFIFVGSSCDVFAEDIPIEWIQAIIAHCNKYPNNRYLFQSKNPGSMWAFLPRQDNFVVCTTLETNRHYPEIMDNSPTPSRRANEMQLMLGTFPLFVTIEPIMDFDLGPFVEMIRAIEPEQVNIGADSGGNKLPEPPYEKVERLIQALQEFTVVKKKKNLSRLERTK